MVSAHTARLGWLDISGETDMSCADTVIWLGDFNYRIGLSRERALELIRRRDLPHLYENDQVCSGNRPALQPDPCLLTLTYGLLSTA